MPFFGGKRARTTIPKNREKPAEWRSPRASGAAWFWVAPLFPPLLFGLKTRNLLSAKGGRAQGDAFFCAERARTTIARSRHDALPFCCPQATVAAGCWAAPHLPPLLLW